MSSDFLDRIKRRQLRNFSEVKPFNVQEYVNNIPLIEKLYEEKQLLLAESLDLRDELEQKTSELETLRLENQRLSSQLDEVKRRSFPIFITSIVSSLLVGIGVNIATSDANQQIGWVMILAGIILEGVIFLLMPK